MSKIEKNKIIPQMFDIRPVDKSGSLDISKIRNFKKIIEIKNQEQKYSAEKYTEKKSKEEEIFFSPEMTIEDNNEYERLLIKQEILNAEKERFLCFFEKNDGKVCENNLEETDFKANLLRFFLSRKRKKEEEEKRKERKRLEENSQKIFFKNIFLKTIKFSVVVFSFFLVFFLLKQGLRMKNEGMLDGQEAITNFAQAQENLKNQDFGKSKLCLEDAYQKLNEISEEINGLGGVLVNVTKYIPYFSKISSGSHLVESGKDISQAGILLSELATDFENIKNGKNEKEDVSYLEIFQKSENKIKETASFLKGAQEHLEEVNIDDVPENFKDKFSLLKRVLPEVNSVLDDFLEEEKIFTDVLGGNGARKYLFLFQNNEEMRPTGGFIGSYAILDISNGRVRKFFIDGIFNPDGQLKENIIPPVPIQKISAGWSLHDSNWFPDFPVSAEKAIRFYEKTGGPTVDGVITMTPTVLKKLLNVTGPIELSEYGITIDQKNFLEKIQYETEVGYDKELNQPKKILADLAPKILDKIFNQSNLSSIAETMNIILESLNEKHILIYSKNWEIEKNLSENGWTGEILETRKDYLSVINTNINGFKTDGMIEEKISHSAEIQEDGSIIDTVNIVREHKGGNTPYDWLNRVNADYMRVYVPKGSKLLLAEGQTREINIPPLDYDALKFKRDPQVEMEEASIQVDEESGTRVYEDSKKTVFANWVYVSPGETVKIKYRYLLPFRINLDISQKPMDSYSVLFQKQSGSIGSKLNFELIFPQKYKIVWNYPETLKNENFSDQKKKFNLETELIKDKFMAISFMKD